MVGAMDTRHEAGGVASDCARAIVWHSVSAAVVAIIKTRIRVTA
jgi:hypothetical protein